jgi:hypothetical protein
MPLDWQRDLSASASDFLRVVWPKISPWLGGGEILPVESATESQDITKLFDQRSGIDAWHLGTNEQMRGIASRVQWMNDSEKPWNTFTVRLSRDSGTRTELEKRLEALEAGRGWLYPIITVQAYIAGVKGARGDLLSVGCVDTEELIRCAQKIAIAWRDKGGNARWRHPGGYGVDRTSNAWFVYVRFEYLACHGQTLKAWPETCAHRVVNRRQRARVLVPEQRCLPFLTEATA